MQLPKDPHTLSVTATSEALSVSPENGLSSHEVKKRTQLFGKNELTLVKEKSLWRVFFNQFKSPIVYLLLAAGCVSIAFGDTTEAVAIFIVILINAFIGFLMEAQARKSMSALRQLDIVKARVKRDEKLVEISSSDVVPGDVLFVEAGDLVCADARLVSISQLKVDESTLTGESMPVSKITDQLSSETSLADRLNLLFKGTVVTRGNAWALVTGTGMQTELGLISSMVQSTKEEVIPLNEKLEAFSKKLIVFTALIVLPLLIIGLLEDRGLRLMIKTTIALAVAAIPEGLPIVATIALARGMLKLSKHHVIVKKLAAVETLGSTNIIFTDKTGTLTENRLTVNSICLPHHVVDLKWNEKNKSVAFQPQNIGAGDEQNLNLIIRVAAICNNASLSGNNTSGDPLEVALLKMASYYRPEILKEASDSYPRMDEHPFDSESKIMGTLHIAGEKLFAAVKGAPEEIVNVSSYILNEGRVEIFNDDEKEQWLKKSNELGQNGLRSLAFAYQEPAEPIEDFIKELVFLGLIGFVDPPREDVPDAIKECHNAGIRVVMVTGDHTETAKHIASRIGLSKEADAHVIHGNELVSDNQLNDQQIEGAMQAEVFSRVSPKQKLELVDLYQRNGWIVGMTGDGVNDAPALKKADIGIAMGLRGTQVARDAATMILQNDSFAAIVKAIKYGRVIFDNIRTFIVYLLSCNLSEILIVALASFMNLSLPLQPLQILFLNIVTDVFPALALGMSDGSSHVMKRTPRNPQEPMITRKYWISIFVYSFAITLSVLSVFLYSHYAQEFNDEISNNIAFFSLAFAQLIHPLNLASGRASFFRNEITRNRHLWFAITFCVVLVFLVYFLPPFSETLSLHPLPSSAWWLVLIGATGHVMLIQILKRLRIVA